MLHLSERSKKISARSNRTLSSAFGFRAIALVFPKLSR